MFWKSNFMKVISPRPEQQNDKGFTRRIHRLFALTVVVLSLSTGALQYFGTPINCWSPADFTGSMVQYADSFCYFNPTYNLPFVRDNILPYSEEGQTPYPNYYKFTPFVLAFVAALYLTPEIIMNFINRIGMINFNSLLGLAVQSQKGSLESRKETIEQLVMELQHRVADKATRHKRTDIRRWIDRILPSLPFFIQLQLIFDRLIFAVGAILPLFFLRNYLSLDLYFKDLILSNSYNLTNPTLFPKQIFCDFLVYRLGNIQTYFIQCNLPANDMFENISLLVCFLALVVCIISISDVISCMVFPLFAPRYYSYIKRHMKVFADINSGYDKEMFRDFVERYLKSNVVYLLQLIGQNSSEHVVCQILGRLWEGYLRSLFSDTTTKSLSPDESKIVNL